MRPDRPGYPRRFPIPKAHSSGTAVSRPYPVPKIIPPFHPIYLTNNPPPSRLRVMTFRMTCFTSLIFGIGPHGTQPGKARRQITKATTYNEYVFFMLMIVNIASDPMALHMLLGLYPIRSNARLIVRASCQPRCEAYSIARPSSMVMAWLMCVWKY